MKKIYSSELNKIGTCLKFFVHFFYGFEINSEYLYIAGLGKFNSFLELSTNFKLKINNN